MRIQTHLFLEESQAKSNICIGNENKNKKSCKSQVIFAVFESFAYLTSTPLFSY